MIAGQTVDITVKFTYLGSDIDFSSYCSPAICCQLGLTNFLLRLIEKLHT